MDTGLINEERQRLLKQLAIANTESARCAKEMGVARKNVRKIRLQLHTLEKNPDEHFNNQTLKK